MDDAQANEDRRLLRLCQQGDEAALADLVRRYQERVFRLAQRMLGDATLAEEAAAQTFVKLWAKCVGWRGDAAPGTWLYRLAVRTALDVQRGQRRWWRRFVGRPLEGVASVHDEAGAAADRDEQQALSRKVHAALAELSETDRAVVHLYYFEQRGLSEIAAMLDSTPEATKMRLARARKRLRRILEASDEHDAR